jgi:hypothetical protein
VPEVFGPNTSSDAAIDAAIDAEGKACVDYSFHVCITSPTIARPRISARTDGDS